GRGAEHARDEHRRAHPPPPPRHRAHADAAPVATAAARAVATHLAESIAASGQASLSLTGGSVGVATAAALARHEVDWDRVTIYFGDERFVPADDPERNDGQLDTAMLEGLGGRPTVHRWPARTRDDDDVDDAAAGFRAAFPAPADDTPLFDVTILGMGPEGHIDSI